MPADGDGIDSRLTRRRGVAANTAIFSLATGASRIIGLGREVLAGSYFGTSGAFSAFTIAFQVPNLLRQLVADQAITSAFVPVFTQLLEEKKKAEAFRLASTFFFLITAVLGSITAFFIIFAPLIMPLFTGSEFQGELDDLVSAGLFGLMDAIRGFDASRGIKFKTYCSTRIRGAILDQLRSQDWVPRLVRLKASRIDRALQRLTAEYGREPTHAELARVLEMEHGDLVQEIQESKAKTMFSLSEKWEDDDGAVEKVEILEDKTATDPVHEMNRRDLMLFITRALTHKERFIIEQYYQYGHTMREIGEMLALTESRVCQIHSNVMSRLKGLLGQRHESLLS